MKRLAPWLLLLALAGAGGCSRPSWQEYTSAEGHFQIQLPGSPQVKTIKQDGGTSSFSQHAVIVQLQKGDFQAAYADLPSRLMMDFSTVIQAEAAIGGGKVLEDREALVGGQKGRCYEMEIERPHRFRSGRLVVVGNRLYHLIVEGTHLRGSSADARRFFDSFQLVR